jgi:hypothetical protein
LGLNALTVLAAQAESIAKRIDPLASHTPILDDLMLVVRSQIVQTVPMLLSLADGLAGKLEARRLPNAGPSALDATVELAQMRQLNALLVNSDMFAMEVYASLRQNASVALCDHLELLDLAMAELDFELAARQCATLIDRLTFTTSNDGSDP